MLRAIARFLKDAALGRLVHEYEPIRVTHGPATFSNWFCVRDRKGQVRLFHKRVYQDPHDVKRFFYNYDAGRTGGAQAYSSPRPTSS